MHGKGYPQLIGAAVSVLGTQPNQVAREIVDKYSNLILTLSCLVSHQGLPLAKFNKKPVDKGAH